MSRLKTEGGNEVRAALMCQALNIKKEAKKTTHTGCVFGIYGQLDASSCCFEFILWLETRGQTLSRLAACNIDGHSSREFSKFNANISVQLCKLLCNCHTCRCASSATFKYIRTYMYNLKGSTSAIWLGKFYLTFDICPPHNLCVSRNLKVATVRTHKLHDISWQIVESLSKALRFVCHIDEV